MSLRPVAFEESFQEWLADRGMSWQEERLQEGGVAGTGSRAFWIEPAGPTERVLFAIHGAGNDALFGWIGLFKELLLTDTAIFTFDLPGHGRGGNTLFGADRARVGVLDAFAACSTRAAGAPIHGVGVSLGGSILLATLAELGTRVRSAALIVAPLEIHLSPRAFAGELRAHNLLVGWREREHYGLTGLVPSFGPFKRDVYPLRLEDTPPPGPFGYVTALNRALASMSLLERAAAVEVPVLLAYGERDRVVPIEQGERIHAALPRSDLLRVPLGTHLSTPMEPTVRSRLLRSLREWR